MDGGRAPDDAATEGIGQALVPETYSQRGHLCAGDEFDAHPGSGGVTGPR